MIKTELGKGNSTEEQQMDMLRTMHTLLKYPAYCNTVSAKQVFDDLMVIQGSNWTSNTSSGSGHLPPDFINKKDSLMMDIMEVDDINTRKNGKKNIQKQRETIAKKNIRGWLSDDIDEDMLEAAGIEVIVNPDTSDIPAKEHHNFESYVRNTNRVISKHIESESLYRDNFPDHKLIFMIYDTSTAYVEGDDFGIGVVSSKYHIPYRDSRMMEKLLKSGVDYLIWFQPYMNSAVEVADYKIGLFPVSRIVCLELSEFTHDELIKFDKDKMHSLEN